MDRLTLFGKGRCGRGLRGGFLVCLMAAAFALLPGDSGAAGLTFAWDLEEGAAGYRLYYGLASRSYSTMIDVGNVSHYSLDVTDGPTYYFALTAYDSAHLESDYSNEIVYATSSSCSYSISPGSADVDARGGTVTVAVSAPADCSWSASAGAAWIRVVSGGTGKGNGRVVYSAQSNTGPPRTAVSTIGGQVFALTQGAPALVIIASAGAGGSIVPSGRVSVPFGSDRQFAITPVTGHRIKSVSVDGNSVGEVGSYTFTGVHSDHSITAVFAPASASCRLKVTTTGTGKGMVFRQPAGSVFRTGATVTMRAIAGLSSWFAGWSGPCSGAGPVCRMVISSDTDLEARFGRIYRVAASHGLHGSISPAGSLKVREGTSLSFIITAKHGYRILDVLVDGVSAGPVGSYTFEQVGRNHSITARFGK